MVCDDSHDLNQVESEIVDLHRPDCLEARHEVSPVPARESPSPEVVRECGTWLASIPPARGAARMLLARSSAANDTTPAPEHLAAGESVRSPRLRYGWAVIICDRVYRFLHRLETPASVVGLAACVEVRYSYRTVQLPSGISIRRGDGIGVLHLNNDFVVALHTDGLSPIALGLEFRRQLVTSLHELARLAGPGSRLNDVKAFSATTIFFHQGFQRLGFEAEDYAPAWPRLVAAYQRALLAALHPAGPARLRGSPYLRALRLWISRETLLTRYGAVRATPRDESGRSAGDGSAQKSRRRSSSAADGQGIAGRGAPHPCDDHVPRDGHAVLARTGGGGDGVGQADVVGHETTDGT